MYHEIFPPLTDKQTVVLPNERSVFQLLELYSEDHKGMPKSYKTTSKCHSNLLPKRCVPIYLEELKFAITSCDWKVAKLYKHYYFEQERYKGEFILTNQKFITSRILEDEITRKFNDERQKLTRARARSGR